MSLPNFTWQQIAFYLVTVAVFAALVLFNKIDVQSGLTAIAFLIGHGAGTISTVQGGKTSGGNDTTTHQTTSTP